MFRFVRISVRDAFRLLVLVALLLAAPAAPVGATAETAPGISSPSEHAGAVPDHYIVLVKAGVDPAALAAAHGAVTRHVYRTAVRGFAAQLTSAQLAVLQRNPLVDYVEQDQVVTSSTTQPVDTWGLDRIDQRSLPLDGTYTYNGVASGVNAYVIDTGIETGHQDFGGRASLGYDALGGNGEDCNGHGTHVSGTIGGRSYGVAKQVRLWAVRVLDCNGSGTISGVIAGVDWVAANHGSSAVANMSLGGGFSPALNNAVTSLVSANVFVAVAAGNSNANACNFSPASAAAAYTVAASDRTDARATFSNFGSCVDGYAPGVAITSDWLQNGTATISGTSMASPHVAGVGALYKGDFGDVTAATITSWITSHATAGVITGNRRGTPNRLLFMVPL